MRIAWFRATPPQSDDFADESAQLIAALRGRHSLEVVTEAAAHDFVWRQARGAFDIAVYELDATPETAFIWPYLLHFPGLLYLRVVRLHASRYAALMKEQRPADFDVERAFGRGEFPELAVPILASRLTAVPYRVFAESLQSEFTHPVIRYLPAGVREALLPPPPSASIVTVGAVVAGNRERGVLERASRRARDAGACFSLVVHEGVAAAVAQSDVTLILDWRISAQMRSAALSAMSAGRPTVVYDVRETADWPSLDPQTWLPRARFRPTPGTCVSIDLLDEEHSIVLALRRLTSDPALRAALGAAAHAWWRTHANIDTSVDCFERLLDEARHVPDPVRPPGWPPHLTRDGSERARAVARQFGVSVDFLD